VSTGTMRDRNPMDLLLPFAALLIFFILGIPSPFPRDGWYYRDLVNHREM